MPMTQQEYETDNVEFGFSVQFDTVGEALQSELGADGFNKHGVKEYDDGSIDVLYRAMEPGVRNEIRITSEFLHTVAGYPYNSIPFQMDHSKSQRDNVGTIEEIWFRDGALGLRGHIPNTGSSVRKDVISDFTHDPPAITDGSISLDRRTTDIELPDGFDSLLEWYWTADPEEDGRPEYIDGQIEEFSLTPFPGGYDRETGGLSPAFRDQFGDPPDGAVKARRGAVGSGRVRGTAKVVDGPFTIRSK